MGGLAGWQACKFGSRGFCLRGISCWDIHPDDVILCNSDSNMFFVEFYGTKAYIWDPPGLRMEGPPQFQSGFRARSCNYGHLIPRDWVATSVHKGLYSPNQPPPHGIYYRTLFRIPFLDQLADDRHREFFAHLTQLPPGRAYVPLPVDGLYDRPPAPVPARANNPQADKLPARPAVDEYGLPGHVDELFYKQQAALAHADDGHGLPDYVAQLFSRPAYAHAAETDTPRSYSHSLARGLYCPPPAPANNPQPDEPPARPAIDEYGLPDDVDELFYKQPPAHAADDGHGLPDYVAQLFSRPAYAHAAYTPRNYSHPLAQGLCYPPPAPANNPEPDKPPARPAVDEQKLPDDVEELFYKQLPAHAADRPNYYPPSAAFTRLRIGPNNTQPQGHPNPPPANQARLSFRPNIPRPPGYSNPPPANQALSPAQHSPAAGNQGLSTAQAQLPSNNPQPNDGPPAAPPPDNSPSVAGDHDGANNP
ncbi:hypothetical protein ACH5RR_024348 [Cinchona calisaya]|uniref:C3H1-type domain-containing protein n=1 Tax=Cinchona calisaya TaxID=153742 RepID=A0ABD2YYH9_9GENT